MSLLRPKGKSVKKPVKASVATETITTKAYDIPEVIHYFCDMRNGRVLTAIHRAKPKDNSLWIFSEAGDYLPEFRDLVNKHGLHEIWHSQSLIIQATLMPIERFKLDGAIICSNIFLLPEAMGMKLEVTPELRFPEPLALDQIESLDFRGATAKLTQVTHAITKIKGKLKGEAAVIGLAAGPWTLMSLMVEGGYSCNYTKAKQWLYIHRKESRRLIEMITTATAEFCLAQARAGAQLIQICDVNAEELDREMYQKFFLVSLKTIRNTVRSALKKEGSTEVGMVMFTKEAHHSYSELRKIGYDILSLTPSIRAQVMKDLFPSRPFSVPENLNPKDVLAGNVQNMFNTLKCTNFQLHLDSFIYSDTPIEGVYAFIDAVRSFHEEIPACSSGRDLNPMNTTTSYSASVTSATDQPHTTQPNEPHFASTFKSTTSKDASSSQLATLKSGAASSKAGTVSPRSPTPSDISSPSDYPSSSYSRNPEHRHYRRVSKSTAIIRPTTGTLYVISAKYESRTSSSTSSMHTPIHPSSSRRVSSTRPSLRTPFHVSSTTTGSSYKSQAATRPSYERKIRPTGLSVSTTEPSSKPTVPAPARTGVLSICSGLTTESKRCPPITPNILAPPHSGVTTRSIVAPACSVASGSKSRSETSPIRSSVTSTLSALASSQPHIDPNLSGMTAHTAVLSLPRDRSSGTRARSSKYRRGSSLSPYMTRSVTRSQTENAPRKSM